MPFYQKGDVRIRYEEAGAGFPLLVTPGGGLNSRVSNWPTAVFNAMEHFKNDFRCITLVQRNANGGEALIQTCTEVGTERQLQAGATLVCRRPKFDLFSECRFITVAAGRSEQAVVGEPDAGAGG
jgi:pimeloyl-ACP methyl ester carboxylesterase